MRIAIDAMGGDDAPDEIIAGVLESIELLAEDDELILVGPENEIEARLPSKLPRKGKISVVHAPDIIAMDDVPIESLRRKPKSSIATIAKLAKRDQADTSDRRDESTEEEKDSPGTEFRDATETKSDQAGTD